MILSFHPLFSGDRNILCAGREPNASDLTAIRNARAVILPQGCSQQIYFMAKNNCPHVFPNYDVRFRYPGKIGQIKLFLEESVPHPPTEIFQSVAEFKRRYEGLESPNLPLVFKFDWGGEGDTVFLVQSLSELEQIILHAVRCEASGQSGFLMQQYISAGNRSVRVTVIGDSVLSYWRTCEDQSGFYSNLSKGAKIDQSADPQQREAAEKLVRQFCRSTGVNLAGLDVIFDEGQDNPLPFLLEINYFFGRVGLGGSTEYYRILRKAIKRWLKTVHD
jgi:ribosomal protein S6--L-glutamate ligase